MNLLNKSILGKNNIGKQFAYLGIKGALKSILGKSNLEIICLDENIYNEIKNLIQLHYTPNFNILYENLVKYYELSNQDSELTEKQTDVLFGYINNILISIDNINEHFFSCIGNRYLMKLADLDDDFDIEMQNIMIQGLKRNQEILDFQMHVPSEKNPLTPKQEIQNFNVMMIQIYASIDIMIETVSFLLENSLENINLIKTPNRQIQFKVDSISIALNECLCYMGKVAEITGHLFGTDLEQEIKSLN